MRYRDLLLPPTHTAAPVHPLSTAAVLADPALSAPRFDQHGVAGVELYQAVSAAVVDLEVRFAKQCERGQLGGYYQ